MQGRLSTTLPPTKFPPFSPPHLPIYTPSSKYPPPLECGLLTLYLHQIFLHLVWTQTQYFKKPLCSISVRLIHRLPPKWGNMDKGTNLLLLLFLPFFLFSSSSMPRSLPPVDRFLHPGHSGLHPPPRQQGSSEEKA